MYQASGKPLLGNNDQNASLSLSLSSGMDIIEVARCHYLRKASTSKDHKNYFMDVSDPFLSQMYLTCVSLIIFDFSSIYN